MRRAARRLLLGIAAMVAASAPAGADELVFPAGTLDRGTRIEATYRLDRPATGRGALHLEWTDAHGRLVERRAIPVSLDDATDIAIPLDLTRAVATENRLRVRLSLDGEGERALDAFFYVPPSDPDWSDYQVIMWQHQDARQYGELKRLGFTAGMAYATRDETLNEEMVGPLLDADLRWYVENIATDFFSTYHRWHPDRPKNWRFLEVKELYRQNPEDPRALQRDPSLSDPAWLAEIRERLAWTVGTYAPYRPLFYNLADEPGIAETAAFWDFDLSEHSLRGMRAWLQEEYGDLAALNRQWGTDFADWDEVVPMTTREAVRREDENFSAWADFKAWMDVAFARAVRAGTDAIHAADPAARSALEGMQIPGWGGYDYTRLADTVDVMEIYDYGENVEIVRSLNPSLIILATSGGSGAREAHVVWRDLLRGSRGVIFWDDEREVVGPDGTVGERGRQAASWIGKIRGGLGALVIGSRRHVDPVAMLYSPASQRTQWMLDVKPHGQAWSERDVEDEYQDNAIRLSSRRFRWAIEHMGLQHRMISPEQIEDGILEDAGIRVLILPWAVSLSPEEAEMIRRFAESGGIVVADGEPGRFDAHSRRLARPLLAELFSETAAGQAIRLPASALSGPETMERLRPILASAGIAPRYTVTEPDGRAVTDVETYVFRNGGTTLLALQRSPAALDESGRAGEPEPLVLSLPAPCYVYDVLGRTSLGRLDRVEISLDGVEPTFLTLSDGPIADPGLSAPARLRPGETGLLRIARPEGSPADLHVLHVTAVGPDGRPVPYYSGNVILRGDSAAFPLPLALNDATGRWTVRVSDAATGRTVAATIEVAAD
ncbi:MAG: hypothetical protein BroJett029_22460 [Alphaproteobacteria bacterium]|nr:MAG: hypothetical protein BroJett029_22460 [Alphaproteobacteria bacterium]